MSSVSNRIDSDIAAVWGMRPKAGESCRRAVSSRATAAVTTATSRFGIRLSRKSSCGILAVAFSAILLLVSGCGDDGVISRFMLKRDHIIVERRPDAAYDQLFPYYVELCATSQFRSKLKGEGGVAGHAVMYIKGACKDEI